MTKDPDPELTGYFRRAETWNTDREANLAASRRVAWIVAGIVSTIAVFEAVAIVALAPLKTVVPYTLLVDRQTGYVQALKPLEADMIAPDTALTRSLLAQYVIARAGFDIASLRNDYRKVALWSAGEARSRYVETMRITNPISPLASLPRSAVVEVEIRGISSLGLNTALVRFTTRRTDAAGGGQQPQSWSAVIRYRFTSAGMSAADRLVNPLGFQVVHYRQSADIVSQRSIIEADTAPNAGLGSALESTQNNQQFAR